MHFSFSPYISIDSPVRRLDARVKIILLAVYSISLFFVLTGFGMTLEILLLALAFVVSRLPLKDMLKLGIPAYILAMLTVVFNMFVFASPEMLVQGSMQHTEIFSLNTFLFGRADSLVAASPVVPLLGSFSFSLAGLMRGVFFGLRIVILVLVSLLVSFTSSSSELVEALNSFMKPLKRFGVPTDDIAMIFSIALRFIPLTAEEFFRVRDAQWSRGSHFDDGTLAQRLHAWQTVFIPLFVGLFRRAERLAQAMDSRCYGMPGVSRTSIVARKMTFRDWFVLIAGAALCILFALFL